MLRDARERYAVPVVEVILPAARRAVAATRNGRVGVICTDATTTSMAYEDAFAAAPQIELTTQACPRFVEFVEAGVTGGAELLAVAHEYLDPLRRRRRRHPGPRLHALPAADRRDLVRHGRRRHAGVQRRGDRQGRLPRCSSDDGLERDPAAAGARRTASSRPGSPASSASSAAGSSAPSSTSVDQFAWVGV